MPNLNFADSTDSNPTWLRSVTPQSHGFTTITKARPTAAALLVVTILAVFNAFAAIDLPLCRRYHSLGRSTSAVIE